MNVEKQTARKNVVNSWRTKEATISREDHNSRTPITNKTRTLKDVVKGVVQIIQTLENILNVKDMVILLLIVPITES